MKSYTPVTLDEYNQSLRDSVNAYYIHALSDPTMSRDEVLQSTAAMSEQYLDAVDAFQAEQNCLNDTPEADIGGTECDDGLDV